jgi:hypothetical protein
LYKTGKIAVYDTDTGALLGPIQITPTPGFSGWFLGSFPTKNAMLFYNASKIYIMDLEGMEISGSLDLPPSFEPESVFFSPK